MERPEGSEKEREDDDHGADEEEAVAPQAGEKPALVHRRQCRIRGAREIGPTASAPLNTSPADRVRRDDVEQQIDEEGQQRDDQHHALDRR